MKIDSKLIDNQDTDFDLVIVEKKFYDVLFIYSLVLSCCLVIVEKRCLCCTIYLQFSIELVAVFDYKKLIDIQDSFLFNSLTDLM